MKRPLIGHLQDGAKGRAPWGTPQTTQRLLCGQSWWPVVTCFPMFLIHLIQILSGLSIKPDTEAVWHHVL